MNKFTRLTALLLALLMLFSNFAVAEAYPVGSMTQEQWAEIVKQAEEEMFSIPEDAGQPLPLPTLPPVESKPYVETHAINLSEKEAFSMSAADNAVLTSEFAAQWQIALPGGAWADLAGQNGTTLEVNYAMLQNVLTDNVAELRQVEYDEEYNVTVLDSVKITIAEAAVVASLDAVSREGEAADATASTDANGAYLLQPANEAGGTIVAVTVQYYYDGTTNAVASPWQATITKGEDLSHTITDLPEQAGYITDRIAVSPAAYADQVALNKQTQLSTGEIDSLGSLDLDLTDVKDDVVITVYYVPAKVQYKVEHYLQNVGVDSSAPVDQQYTLDTTDVYDINSDKAKKTGETVGEGHARTYTGFYSLWYDPSLEIAADGSTVLAVYYIRNYYLMSFDLGEGGYGVNPIYDQYGATIGDVGTPKRPGYTFVGWTADANNTLVDATGYDASKTSATVPVTTMPAENTTYYAVWDMADTAKVTVVFWGENANDTDDSYIQTGTLMLPSLSEYTFSASDIANMACATETHTHSDACGRDLSCTITEHEHSAACCNVSTEHTHTRSCYSNSGIAQNASNYVYGAPSGVADGYVYVYQSGRQTYRYVYIAGSWYSYDNRNVTDGTIITLTLGNGCNAHTHGDGNCSCSQAEHEHTDDCYTYLCGKAEHTHSDACKISMDPNLWTLVTEDMDYTETVQPDGSTVINVYYDRTTFTLTFHYDATNTGSYYNPEYSYAKTSTIQAKWGADIGQQFLNVSTTANGNLWSRSDTGDSPWTSYLQIMPQENRDYYCRIKAGSTQDAEYYAETLTDGEYERKYTVKAYYEDGYLTISAEDFYPMEGFTYSHGTDGAGNDMPEPGRYGYFDGAKFYYDRHHYAIEYYSPLTQIKKVTGVAFEETLGKYAYTPTEDEIPDIYEEGSVVFGGWYLNPECTGEEFVFSDEHKMSACPNDGDTGLVVYAKWVPKEYEVKFYLDSDTSETGTLLSTQTVQHGSYAVEPDEDLLVNGALTFADVWVYVDENGNEITVDPESYRITGNTVFYAKWTYNNPIPVVINYELADGTPVADPYNYQMMYIEEKTFEAKTGTKLYDAYQSGYYPTVTSHTITGATETIIYNPDGTVKGFVYTFIYQKVDNMSYTVRYLDAATGQPLLTDKVVNDTTLHIVTEDYVPIPGYLPDVYTQRLLLNADPTKNVITFYYTRDTVNALYTVTHYTQNVTCTAYELYRDTTSFQGTIGQKYGTSQAHAADNAVITTGIDILTIPNFEFSHAVIVTRELAADNTLTTTPDGVEDADKLDGFSDTAFTTYIIKNPAEVVKALTSGGMDIYLYYNRTVTTLTIKKVGLTSGEHAIANVTLNGTQIQIVLDSSNATNGVVIENVAIGTTYSISEPDWAWRYDTVAVDAPSGTISGPTVVTITNSNKTNTWLDSECYAENEFGEAN